MADISSSSSASLETTSSPAKVEVPTRARAASTSHIVGSDTPTDDPSRTPRQRSRTEFDNRPYAAADNWTLSHGVVGPRVVPRTDSISSSRSSSLSSAASQGSDQRYPEDSYGRGSGSAEGNYVPLVTGVLGLAVLGGTVVEAQGHDAQSKTPIGHPLHGRPPILMDEPFEHAGFGSGDDGFLSAEEGTESVWRGRGRESRSTNIMGRLSRSASQDWSSSSSLREVPSSTNISSWTPDRSPPSSTLLNISANSPAGSIHTPCSRSPSTSDAVTQQNSPAHLQDSPETLTPSPSLSTNGTEEDQSTITSVKQLVLQTRRSSRPAVCEFTADDERRSSIRSMDRARDGLGLNLELFEIDQGSPSHLSVASPAPSVNVARSCTPSVAQSDQSEDERDSSTLGNGLHSSPRSATSTSSNADSVSPFSFLAPHDSPVLSTDPSSSYSPALPVTYNTSPSIAESSQFFLARTTENPMLPASPSNRWTSSAPQVETWAGVVPMPAVRSRYALSTPDASFSAPTSPAPIEKGATVPTLAVRTGPWLDQSSKCGAGRSRQTSNGSDMTSSKTSRRLSSFFSKWTPSSSPSSLSRPTTPGPPRSPIEDSGSRPSRTSNQSKASSSATSGPPASIHKSTYGSSSASSTLKKGKVRGIISLPSPATTDPVSTSSSESSKKVLSSSPMPTRTLKSIMSAQDYDDAIAQHGMLEMKRQEVIFELCETERLFVDALRGVMEVFALPLRDRQGGWIRGVPTVVARLFDWAADLVYLHSQIAEALQKARGTKPQDVVTRIADVFTPFIPQLEIHLPYLVRFEIVTRLIERMATDQNSDFGAFIRMQTRSFLGGMTLSSFLLKPVQRLMKYPLFFKQLCELTPKDHVDYRTTTLVLRDTDFIIRVMQEVKSREDEYEDLKRIESKMRGLPQGFRLAQRDRRLLAQGLMKRIHASEKDRIALLETEGSGIRRRPSNPAISEQPLDASSLPVKLPLLVESRRSPSGTSDSGSDDPSNLSEHDRSSWPAQYASLDSTASSPKSASAITKRLPELPNGGPGVFSPSPVSMGFDRRVNGDSPNVFALSLPKRPTSSMSFDSVSGRRPKPLKLRAKETNVQVFIFSDLVVLAQRTHERGTKMSSKGTSLDPDRPGTTYQIVESFGMSKVERVIDLSGQTEHDNLLAVTLSPITSKPTTIFLTVAPHLTSGSSRLTLSTSHIHARWMNAFERSRIKSAKLSNLTSVSPTTLDIPVTTDERALAASLLRSPSEGYTAHFEPLDERVDLTSERAERDWWRVRYDKMRSELVTSSSPQSTH
ncbi:BQ2448_4828 [Microbotryum intermedium]|uniref:BQ2448_4828 protein n=1 Tax=Microbotryum intermedium TaxID=269621 RepID=A0A238FJR7_9BASI|nr:BQ2448_4828 [Microbotryum intermedium]